MKLPNDYFENLTISRYREYLKLLPNLKKESSQAVTMIIFTLLALSIFGLFAIEPTLATIIGLKKQLADSEFVKEQMTEKIANLSSLQQQYSLFSPQLPILYDAIPQSPQVAVLSGQVAAIAQQSGISISSFRVDQVQLSQQDTLSGTVSSFVFFAQGEGDYNAVHTFIQRLIDFDRIITIDSISVNIDPQTNLLEVIIQANGYYK